MEPSEIQPFDMHRIFLGETPWWFLLEIVFRTVVLYLFTLGMVRLVRQRAVGQLTVLEFLLVVALGSATGDPMFYPDVPLLHGMVVIAVVILMSRGMTWMVNTNEGAERFVEGSPKKVVDMGTICLEGMERARLNRETLFELLRMEGVRYLGEVEVAYLEQKGQISVFRLDLAQQRPGLRVMPPWDLDPPLCLKAGDAAPVPAILLGCECCGHILHHPTGLLEECPCCQGVSWVDAVYVFRPPPPLAPSSATTT